MNYSVLLLLQILISCNVPVQQNKLTAEECERQHMLGDLSISLSCEWQLENTRSSMYWMRSGRNTVLLQHGDMVRPVGPYDADSSLAATFRERPVQGRMASNKNTMFIHGMRTAASARGDSIYIYMEDTATWKYYHFDGFFLDAGLRDGFLGSMRGSELIR